MPTTTIRLSDELKARVAEVATTTGTNSHSFILQAISDKLDLAEQQANFQSVARQRYARIAASGQAIAWADMRRYLQERVAGKAATKPKARRLGV